MILFKDPFAEATNNSVICAISVTELASFMFDFLLHYNTSYKTPWFP